jgi:hypothetical protein
MGEWGAMVRDLADYDPGRYAQVLKWPLAEALSAYEAGLKADAAHDYETQVKVWSTLAATGATKEKKPPKLPDILKG